MIPKSLPSDLIRGWAPVFGKDHAHASAGLRIAGIGPRIKAASRCPTEGPLAASGSRRATMTILSTYDLIALAGFIVAWGGYSLVMEYAPYCRRGLNARMNEYREAWMRRMLAR